MHVAAAEGKKHQRFLQRSSSQLSAEDQESPHLTPSIGGAYPAHPQRVPLDVKLNN